MKAKGKFSETIVGLLIGLLILGAAMAYFLIIPISFRILVYFTMQGGAVPFILLRISTVGFLLYL